MKYNNSKVQLDNHVFDSKMEARYYRVLMDLILAGVVERFEMQVPFLLQEAFKKNGKHYRAINYIADFLVVYADGRIEVVDVKGQKTETFKLKHKLFEYKYPHFNLKLLTDKHKYYDFIDLDEYLKAKKEKAKLKGVTRVATGRRRTSNSRTKYRISD